MLQIMTRRFTLYAYAFTDYEGNAVTLINPPGETDKGLAYLDLPVKNAAGTKQWKAAMALLLQPMPWVLLTARLLK